MARVPLQGRGDITVRHILVVIMIIFGNHDYQTLLRTLLFVLLALISYCAQNPNSVVPLHSVKAVVNVILGLSIVYCCRRFRY